MKLYNKLLLISCCLFMQPYALGQFVTAPKIMTMIKDKKFDDAYKAIMTNRKIVQKYPGEVAKYPGFNTVEPAFTKATGKTVDQYEMGEEEEEERSQPSRRQKNKWVNAEGKIKQAYQTLNALSTSTNFMQMKKEQLENYGELYSTLFNAENDLNYEPIPQKIELIAGKIKEAYLAKKPNEQPVKSGKQKLSDTSEYKAFKVLVQGKSLNDIQRMNNTETLNNIITTYKTLLEKKDGLRSNYDEQDWELITTVDGPLYQAALAALVKNTPPPPPYPSREPTFEDIKNLAKQTDNLVKRLPDEIENSNLTDDQKKELKEALGLK